MQRTCELSFPIYSTVILRLARVLVSVHVLASVLFELSRRDIHILTQTHVAYTVYLVVLRDGVAPCVETGGWRGGGRGSGPHFLSWSSHFCEAPTFVYDLRASYPPMYSRGSSRGSLCML